MSFAVLFPGQGSQSVGMLAALADSHAAIGETFGEASEVFGRDLWALAQGGPAEALADTRVTQPLMFTADIALWRALRAAGLPAPDAVAGHSLGEFAALVAAGAIDFDAGLALVRRRASLMASAVPEGEGGMAALIGMDDAAVVELCESMTGERVVEAVNFNAPGQIAISGHLDALERTLAEASERGCKRALMLPVSVPNHSSLMRPAGRELAPEIDAATWREPACPVVQNANATAPASLDALLESLRAHVYGPVRWGASVQALRDVHGCTTMLECGPGRVLTGLVKRIDRSITCLPSDVPEAFERCLEALGSSVAEASR